jgi:hypothetical protein
MSLLSPAKICRGSTLALANNQEKNRTEQSLEIALDQFNCTGWTKFDQLPIMADAVSLFLLRIGLFQTD